MNMTRGNVCERDTLVDGVSSVVESRFAADGLPPKTFVSAFDSVSVQSQIHPRKPI